jgi:hypothetical protein
MSRRAKRRQSRRGPKVGDLPRLVLRRHDRIGANDAEEDRLLAECFVDTGDLAILKDCRNPQRIVVGRTGCGKSALLLQLLATEPHAISVCADNLALSYISNSNILRFFESAGLSLEVFYKLIWRHAFAVELLKHKFGIKGERKGGFIEWLRGLLRSKQHRAALEYLEKWSDKFWEQTESRVKDLTTKTEEQLKCTLEGELAGVAASTGNAKTLSSEVRERVIRRGQRAISEAHVPALNELIDLLADVFDDPQNPHYLVVDRLDEAWVEDELRHKLIMALLETAKDFRRIANVKLVIALRTDLLQRVFARARGPGFQEEKLATLYLRINWQKENLIDILNTRINHTFRDRYSKNVQLTHKDVFVGSRSGDGIVDYIIDRTLMRPRDLIAFTNECLAVAEGKSRISFAQVDLAEGPYSRSRLQSVVDEWFADYPNLNEFALTFLRDTETPRKLSELFTEDLLAERCLELSRIQLTVDPLATALDAFLQAGAPWFTVVQHAVSAFHNAGIIGLKLSAHDGYNWFSERWQKVRPSEISPVTSIRVHPMLRSALTSREIHIRAPSVE